MDFNSATCSGAYQNGAPGRILPTAGWPQHCLISAIRSHLVNPLVNVQSGTHACWRTAGPNTFIRFHYYTLVRSSLCPPVWVWTRQICHLEGRKASAPVRPLPPTSQLAAVRIPILGPCLTGGQERWAVPPPRQHCSLSTLHLSAISPYSVQIRYSWQHYQIKAATELKKCLHMCVFSI